MESFLFLLVILGLVLRVEVPFGNIHIVCGFICDLVKLLRGDYVFGGDVGSRDYESCRYFEFNCGGFHGGGSWLGVIFRGNSVVCCNQYTPTGGFA